MLEIAIPSSRVPPASTLSTQYVRTGPMSLRASESVQPAHNTKLHHRWAVIQVVRVRPWRYPTLPSLNIGKSPSYAALDKGRLIPAVEGNYGVVSEVLAY
jgi:hypothetical protein